jgi:uncharacterized protein (TIGR02646 family)
MMRLAASALPLPTQQRLQAYQQEVDDFPNYAEQVDAAERLFSNRNRPTNAVFKVVRATLAKMCGELTRCCYCECSCGDEVEHHHPKNFFPQYVFVWENYLYACGNCNGPKRNRFALLAHPGGKRIDLVRQPGGPVLPPPPGQPLLIDPRREDPLAFMELDLAGTFEFVPTAAKRSRNYKRAEYTIDVLRLNARPVLTKARRVAFESFRARLYEYRAKRAKGVAAGDLDKLERGLRMMNHQTVWAEMKRQRELLPELAGLFAELPEALTW